MIRSLEDDVRDAWGSVSGALERIGPEPTPGALCADWDDTVRRLRETFSAYAGPQAVAERFEVPADYSAFMTLIGGGWQWQEWGDLFDARAVAAHTQNGCATFAEDQAERKADDGFWIHVGCRGDKHDYFLCADRKLPYFGIVAEAEDYHPWLAGIEPLWFCEASFRDFLRGEVNCLIGRDDRPRPWVSITNWLKVARGGPGR